MCNNNNAYSRGPRILDIIAVEVSNSNHGTFLVRFAEAWQHTDPSNKRILQNAWLKLISKYNLHEEYKTVIARILKNGEIIPQPKKEEPTPKMKVIAQYRWDTDKEDWVLKEKK